MLVSRHQNKFSRIEEFRGQKPLFLQEKAVIFSSLLELHTRRKFFLKILLLYLRRWWLKIRRQHIKPRGCKEMNADNYQRYGNFHETCRTLRFKNGVLQGRCKSQYGYYHNAQINLCDAEATCGNYLVQNIKSRLHANCK